MKWKSFTGIVLIVGYHWEIGRIERFPAILPSMEWLKNQATSLDLYKTHWIFAFGFIDSRRPLLYRGASALLIEYQVKGPEKRNRLLL